ncbi:MAG: hypothetical protein C4576_20215 [Desulfobacteraceae bacterium]|nr:MAG: hypothetical protein C4576_20215 [Desulfobacteraceae bacterium]
MQKKAKSKKSIEPQRREGREEIKDRGTRDDRFARTTAYLRFAKTRNWEQTRDYRQMGKQMSFLAYLASWRSKNPKERNKKQPRDEGRSLR